MCFNVAYSPLLLGDIDDFEQDYSKPTLNDEEPATGSLAVVVPHDAGVVAGVEGMHVEEPQGDAAVLVDDVPVVVAVDDLVAVLEPGDQKRRRAREPGLQLVRVALHHEALGSQRFHEPRGRAVLRRWIIGVEHRHLEEAN